ncbi:MAG TPA: PilT/PilU family type 4a pilus ATPase [Chthoniobacterales bacterium]
MNKEILDALLTGMLESSDGLSDMLFVADKAPLVEVHGRLLNFPIDAPNGVLTPELIEQMARIVIADNERLTSDLAERGSCDCSYALGEVARLRTNIFKQRGRLAMVMRKLQSNIPNLENLQLPPVFREIIKEKNGIVFVTGGTGSGKTTTLAAMLNELNRTQEIHILTLEDPIEFVHPHQLAAFSQRELGKDFANFADGLRAALRQAPKVILVGEIRDRETMEIAMTAAETGHLVFSTLHTINAGQTINRILGLFSSDEEQQLRQRLTETLRYVVSQRLVPKLGGGRMLVMEIMGNNLRTREAILYGEGENRSFQDIIEAGSTQGWHSFDQSLFRACAADLISDETAQLYSTNKSRMRRDLDQLRKQRGRAGDEPSGLKLEKKVVPVLPPEIPSGAPTQ